MARCLPAAAALSLACLALPASAQWREVSTDHFLIYADANEAWARGFAEKLERFDSAMRVGRGWVSLPEDRANRVVVYVVKDMAAVQQLYAPGRASSVGGFYIPRTVSVAFVPQDMGVPRGRQSGETILFHEYAHHLMFRNMPYAIPKWYGEGFAEVQAAALMAGDGSVQFGRHAGGRAYSLMNANSLPIEKLIAGDDGGNGDLFYGRSWLLAHMMMFDPARAGQLAKYLTLIRDGTPNMEAARTAFGDLRALDRALDAYQSRLLTTLTIPADRIKVGTITVRALGAGEVAMMPVRLRSERGVDAAQAKLVVAEARRRAAGFPNDPAVQSVLAEAEYDAGNDTEAEAAADRALAADPARPDALLYKGRILIRRAKAAGTTDAATWRAARGWFIKAAAAAPDSAEPLALYYDSFQQQGIAPTANANAAGLRAFDLAPQDGNRRFQAARIMLAEGKTKQARLTLQPLAFNPKSAGEGNFASKLIAMIDAGEPAAKIAAARPEKGAESDGEDDGTGDSGKKIVVAF